MSTISDLFARLVSKIPVRGTVTTPTGDETFPVAISNEIMGGPFIVNTIDEMSAIPQERLVKGCKCTVNEHLDEGVTEVTRTYMLKSLPSETISDIPGVNISDYWILDMSEQQEESAIESQYSPNYNGGKPPFLSAVITTDAYNAGYGSTADFESGDTSLKIWEDEYSFTEHKWVRQRSGATADWGIPVLVNEGYSEGTYSDVRFQWVLNVNGTPAKPASMVNGSSNNSPTGWNDTPDIPVGEDYNTYILTNSLWSINGIKGVYGSLQSEWSTPIKVSTDPNLVRYGVDANNSDYLDDTYWRAYYTSGDKYKASRTSLTAEWIVERISGESGEYIDYVFKEFIDSYEPLTTDAPTTTLGYGINGWIDGVFTSQDGYTLYVSTARKFSDGSLSEGWTTPARYDGKNTVRTIISTLNNVGQTFKYSQDAGSSVITPSAITMKAELYDATDVVDPSTFTKVEWYKGTPETGVLIANLTIGTAPNRNPQYGGTKNQELTIYPENVDKNQIYTAKIFFNGEDYVDTITIVDVTDGVGYQVIIESTTGFIFKGTETKTFTAYLYENGVDISTSAGVAYEWRVGGNDPHEYVRTLELGDVDVDGITGLESRVTFLGNTYSRVESLTDIFDGVSIERQYSSMDIIDLNDTPDTPGNPSGWSADSTDTIWVIERYEGSDWGVPYKVKGEKGAPNGVFRKTVYRTRAEGTTPAWLGEQPTAQTDSNSALTPDDWTDIPEQNAATGSYIYASEATFMKSTTESTDEFVENWDITAAKWSLPYKLTHFAGATVGEDGTNGWSPVIVVEVDGDRRVHKIQEYVGGTGTKPAGEGYYLSATGLVATASLATDIRGSIGVTGPKGDDGVFDAGSDFWEGDESTIYQIKGGSGSRYWDIRFRLAKTGVVYYTCHVYAASTTSAAWVGIQLPSFATSNKVPASTSVSFTNDFSVKTVLNGSRFDGASNLEADNTTENDKGLIVLTNGIYYARFRFSPDYCGIYEGCYNTYASIGQFDLNN